MGQHALPVPVITAPTCHPQGFPSHLTRWILWFWLQMTLGIDLAVVPREKPHTGAAAREQPRDSPVIER